LNKNGIKNRTGRKIVREKRVKMYREKKGNKRRDEKKKEKGASE
jgi:hypothetical protein